MENQNLKTSVFSIDTVFSESAEQPIDIDFTLPDYYADISKILKCRAVARVAAKCINGSNISIDGCVTVTVIYCGSDNCISSYEYQYPFSKTFDTGIDTDGCSLNVKAKCEYINCRAVTGRKVDIHGAIGIYVNITRRCLTDVISDYDDCNIELLRDTVPATIPMGSADKYLLIEEEIELGTAQPDIRCIVRYDAQATVTDTKIMAGKVMVKGDMRIKLLYMPEGNGAPQTVRYQLPFSQLIEIEGISEECDCESKVSIAQLEIKPRVSASGECRQLMLNAKLLVTSMCCCNNDIAVIVDAYSRKYEADILKNDVCFNKIIENINQNHSCKKKLEFPDGALSSICDMWCEVRTDNVKFYNNAMNITGVVTAFIVAQDNQAVPTFYEKTIDFEYAYPMNTDGDFRCAPEISVISANYTITTEQEMELRVELNICASIYRCSNLPLITNIKINDSKPISKKSESAMTVYYASKGEKLWDIARKYFAGIDEIKQINDIYDDVLGEDKMLLISNA